MIQIIPLYRPPLARRLCIAAAVIVAIGAAADAAYAGECPANQRVADGQGQKPGPSMPQGVTDTVRASTNLALEPVAIKSRQFRLRQLEIQPGGIVPWHSHNERPAMIYIVSGEVIEYASNCALPITHRAGDVAPEKAGISHWWKNPGNQPAVLISVDLFPGDAPHMDPHQM
jgi:quercetin dioxygenase-like cupin family protein